MFPVIAAQLTPSFSTDYLALRAYLATPGRGHPDQWSRVDFAVLSETGRACATATNDRCQQKMEGHPSGPLAARCRPACIEVSAVTTRGDNVERWATLAQMRELLGVVDTEHEALLLVASAGYDLSCDPQRTRVHGSAGGYEVFATRIINAEPPYVRIGYRLHVSPEGAVTLLAEEGPLPE